MPVEDMLNLTPDCPTTNVWAILSRLFKEIIPVVAKPENQFKPVSVELSAPKK